jgi:hypothetical protein
MDFVGRPSSTVLIIFIDEAAFSQGSFPITMLGRADEDRASWVSVKPTDHDGECVQRKDASEMPILSGIL